MNQVPTRPAGRVTSADRVGALVPAALASAGAGVVHAAVIGSHTDMVGLTRLFMAATILQLGVAFGAMLRPASRVAAAAIVAVNVGALGVWVVTRATGISWIAGLERAQSIGLADALAAALAALAALGAAAVLSGKVPAHTTVPVAGVAILVAALCVPAVVDAASHHHNHDHDHDHAHGTHGHGAHGHGAATAHAHDVHGSDDHGHVSGHGDGGHGHGGAGDDDGHGHDGAGDGHGHNAGPDGMHGVGHRDDEPVWPRPWDPADPIDFSGVPGVTAEQQARAEQLVADTLEILPRFADVSTIAELGFRSIGDERTGFEHFINVGYIADEHFLDPRYPESLVYRVDDEERTLVSAMFIASGRAVDDPELVDFGGPLMEWHVHDNLCWRIVDGVPVVAAVTDNHGGSCPEGTFLAGGDNPMVHVWVTPHECGPFAALEGHGAGQAAGTGDSRADQCDHDHHGGHGGHGSHGGAVPPRPYDPALPIDLGGVPGVTLEQQAFAEQLVAVTLRYLPQWEDPAVAEAAGFRSIADGATGHEHYVNWAWIDDDVWLDPNYPESLVYEPQPDGSKTLVSAMYMLPGDMALEDVPDWGGALMQWHIHDDLCFTDDPVAPRVAAVVQVGGNCPAPFVKMPAAPMIHVWIRPHECGPFAALDGVGAGQVAAGEEHFCNEVHGAGH